MTTNTETTEITVERCDLCSVSVYAAGVLLFDANGTQLCLNCLDSVERQARTDSCTGNDAAGLARRELHAATMAAALERLDAEKAAKAAEPIYSYKVVDRDGPAVERLAKNAAGPWKLSTGVIVLEDDLEVCSYVAAYLNAKVTRTSDAEGLEPLESIEAILVRRALESIVWEMADGDVDETGVWVDASCWQAVGTTRAAELGQ